MSARRLRWALLAGMALVLAATFAAMQFRNEVARGARVERPRTLGPAPSFDLVDRDGQPFGSADLAGRPWVANFIFTRCALSCPRLTSLMRRLESDRPELALVSFSVDPENDTPEILDDYARSYGIDNDDWHFLSGETGEMRDLVVAGFKLPLVEEAPAESVAAGEAILHSNRFVLVDGAGAIRGYYQVTEPGEYEKLLRDLADLPSEPVPPRGERAMFTADDVEREIVELHAFFEAWFRGELPATATALERFEGVLAADFSIIGPAGLELDRAGVLELVRGAHGSRSDSDFAIWIDNVRLRDRDERSCLVTYEEWQQLEEGPRGRVSTALLEVGEGPPNGLLWKHVQETWLPETAELSEPGSKG